MLLSRRQAMLDSYPEYSGPEWGCEECNKKKKELDSYEEGYNLIRNHLEKILDIYDASTSRNDLDYLGIHYQVLKMCNETGVDYSTIKLKQVK